MTTDTATTIRAAILGSVALLPLLVLPGLVGALIDYAGFTESEAGWVASAGFAGNALGAVFAGLRIRHLDPRRLAVVGLIVLAVFDAASILVSELPASLFVALRFFSGFGGAIAYGAVVASIAALANPERGYGIFMVFQFGFSGFGLYGLPYLLELVSLPGLFGLFAGLALISLMLRRAVIHREAAISEPGIEFHMLVTPASLLMLFGIGLYETANLMHYTYDMRIGLGFGFTDYEIARILGASTILGVPSALAVVWIGDRFGQLRPLALALLASIAAMLILLYPVGPMSYAVSMFVMGCTWAFGLPYFYAVGARIDPGGSVVVVAGFFTSLGATLGPALAAMLVAPGYYDDVLLFAVGLYGIVAALMTVCVAQMEKSQA